MIEYNTLVMNHKKDKEIVHIRLDLSPQLHLPP